MSTVKYYIISETPSEKRLVSSAGEAVHLKLIPGVQWVTAEMFGQWYNTVQHWRGEDRRQWLDAFGYQALVPLANIAGIARQDPGPTFYPLLPNYHKTGSAWRNFGWIFIPFGAANPFEEGQVVEDPNAIPTVSTPTWGGDDDLDGDAGPPAPPPAPTVGGYILRGVISLGTGGLIGFITWKLLP